MLNNGITGSQVEVWLNDKFLSLIDQYNWNEKSKRTMNIVQEWVSFGYLISNLIINSIHLNKFTKAMVSAVR